MRVGLSLIDAMPGALGLLVYDIFQYFSWWVYLGTALAYSALTFTGEWSKDGPLIFSRKNARPLQVVMGIHISFLAILLLVLKILVRLDPSTPDWMTRNIGGGNTMLDLFFISGMIIMSFIERRWLYVEPDTDTSEHSI